MDVNLRIMEKEDLPLFAEWYKSSVLGWSSFPSSEIYCGNGSLEVISFPSLRFDLS
jgi:hypothetical protein